MFSYLFFNLLIMFSYLMCLYIVLKFNINIHDYLFKYCMCAYIVLKLNINIHCYVFVFYIIPFT